jgi:spoIIIJ-associated protein
MTDSPDTQDPRPSGDLTAEGAGETVGEAKWAAMKDLEPRFPGITAECVNFQILSEGGDGPARVVAEVNVEAWRDVASGDLPEEPIERLRAVVTRVVQSLGLQATVDVTEADDELRATVEGEDLGLLIGKHGTTIDALQHLAARIVRVNKGERKEVVIDAAGYRERRETVLHQAADRAIDDALRYGRPVEMEPMRALERKVVHLYLRDRTDVDTHSEGDEPERRLVVSPVGSTSSSS